MSSRDLSRLCKNRTEKRPTDRHIDMEGFTHPVLDLLNCSLTNQCFSEKKAKTLLLLILFIRGLGQETQNLKKVGH